MLLWLQGEAKRCLGKAREARRDREGRLDQAERGYSALYCTWKANSIVALLHHSDRHFPNAEVAATLPASCCHATCPSSERVHPVSVSKVETGPTHSAIYIPTFLVNPTSILLHPSLTDQSPPPTTPFFILPIARALPRASARLPALRFARTSVKSIGSMASEPINPEVVSRVSAGLWCHTVVQNDTRGWMSCLR